MRLIKFLEQKNYFHFFLVFVQWMSFLDNSTAVVVKIFFHVFRFYVII